MRKFVAFAVGCGLAVGLASAQAPSIWSHPTVPAPEALARLGLQFAWRTFVPVEGLRDGIATVQHLGDVIVVQTRSGAVSALDPNTGATLWRTAVGNPYPVIHTVGYNDLLILVSNGTQIQALNRANGRPLWEVDLPTTPLSPPAADHEAFYVCLTNGRLTAYAFPAEVPAAPAPGARPTVTTGGALTARESSGAAVGPAKPSSSATGQAAAAGSGAARVQPVPARPSATAPTVDPRSTTASSGLAGGGRTVTVGVSTSGGRTTTTATTTVGGRTAVGGGVDINRSGRSPTAAGGPRMLWDFQTHLRVAERPALSPRTILLASTSRTALFVEKTYAAKPAEYQAEAAITAPIGQYGDRFAYLGTADGGVYALDMEARVALWHFTANGAVTTRTWATDEDLYVIAARGGVIRLNRENGELIWQNPQAADFLASNPRFVYAIDRQGRLMVLDRTRGTALTTLDTRDFNVTAANEKTDRVLLAANDGTIVCLHDRAYPRPRSMQNPPAIAPAAPAPAAAPAEQPPAEPAKPAEKPAGEGKSGQ